jgi:uncharacterized protein YlxW (UPF0749 family)
MNRPSVETILNHSLFKNPKIQPIPSSLDNKRNEDQKILDLVNDIVTLQTDVKDIKSNISNISNAEEMIEYSEMEIKKRLESLSKLGILVDVEDL